MDEKTIKDTPPSLPPSLFLVVFFSFSYDETVMKAVRVHVWFRVAQQDEKSG